MNLKSNLYFFTLFLFILGIGLLTNCRKESILDDTSAKVEFSKDSLVFDTVFSTIGSTYHRFTVRNPYNKKLILSNIRLQNGTKSMFRINVDGVPTVSINEVEIEANDSIYILAEVTIDPNNANNPFVVEDKIIFNTNGNIQEVILVAWGQNAYFHYNELVCNETWATDKPHVLYGITAVGYPKLDSGCVLTIPAGAKIYAHTDAVLYVYKSSLFVNGTHGNEVVFEGDRREERFEDVPGQWFGIRFSQPKTSKINYAIIKNGTAGIYVDTADGSDIVTIDYTISKNHTYASLFAQGARIESENCLFVNSGLYSAGLKIGGDYKFNHCTFGNYWNHSSRTSPAVLINNWYEDNTGTIQHRPIVKADFTNCIMYGANEVEFFVDTVPGSAPNYSLNYCVIKTSNSLNSKYTNMKNNVDPRFKSIDDFHLLSGSVAIGWTDNLTTSNDLDDKPRISFDAGCYEK